MTTARAEMARLRLVAQFINILSTFILLVALALGLFIAWHQSEKESTIIIVFAFVSLFLLTICLALRYYFSFVSVSRVLSHIWIGCIIGVVTFTANPEYDHETVVQIMNALFLTSFALKTCWHVMQRFLRLLVHKPILLSKSEAFELLGLGIPPLVVWKESSCLTFFVISLAILIIAIRFKSSIGVLNLLLLAGASFFHFFPKMNVHVNSICLVSFVGRVTVEAVLDLFFSPLSVLEHWSAFLQQSVCTRRLAILAITCLELAYCSLTAYLMPNHKEWYVAVPIFTAAALVWFAFHTMFVISLWKLMNKVTECYATFDSLSSDSRNINSIMASKGVRHFSLVVDRLVLVMLVFTVLVGAVGWTTKTICNVGLFVVVFPIECMFYSLILELGTCLGGTCTGYALVAPVCPQSANGSATLLPLNKAEEINSRATSTLNTIHNFFTFHLIDNFGCDYSSSGMSLDSLGNKLQAFFGRRTSDGPRFDTYLIYYSGAVQDSGDWALANNSTLTLHTLIEWWEELNVGSDARLILILDTLQSVHWIKQMRAECRRNFIALQTLRAKKPKDIESGCECVAGDFTKTFLQFNSSSESVDWKDPGLTYEAVYSTSKYWTDFSFHLPTNDDMTQYWSGNFPKFTKPLMVLVTCGRGDDVCCCCSCVTKCLKRKKQRWFPRRELDTGHGFKLIRS